MARRKFANDQPLLTAVSSGTSAIIPAANCQSIVIYVEYSSASSAGSVVAESASRANFPGSDTWVTEGNSAWAAAGSQDRIQFDGPVDCFRVRIDSDITDGTVTVTWNALEER